MPCHKQTTKGSNYIFIIDFNDIFDLNQERQRKKKSQPISGD